ncbi:zinc finger protein 2 [Bicyclus anynana]|uniref:Zinc finger protein 2 n=1 Tax=Bicyclus anynana TaxID=110368 RepID=A0ABM3LIW5_BICAN|nr:zinc finger protein 2 [Bicyclus anynana]XP_052739008.1 zinc finger protein 2 [Bicyclus anynana]
MSEILNLSSLCRCCHTDGCFRSLNQSYSDRSVTGDAEIYVEMLYETFRLYLSQPSIEASHSICDECIVKLRSALQFKKQIQQCEEKFQNYCRNELLQHTEIKIEKQFSGDEIEVKPDIKIEDFNNQDNDDFCNQENVASDIETEENTNDKRAYKTEEKKSDQKSELTITLTRLKKCLKKEKSLPSKAKVLRTIVKNEKSVSKGAKTTQTKRYSKVVQTVDGPVYKCLTCMISFKCRQTLKLHMDETHAIFSCNICEKKFRKEEQLRAHTLTHTLRYECNVCGKRIKRRSDFKTHKMMHSKELKKIFTCDLCNKDFTHRSTIIKHFAFHNGTNKKFVCDKCGKSFNDRTNLNIHIQNVHYKLKMFKCDQCPKTYAANKTLKVHLRIHTGERFKCPDCDKDFISTSALFRHKRDYHNSTPTSNTGVRSYKCKVCEEKFYTRGSFASHTRTHVGVKPFQCHLCDKDFTCKYSLKRHIDAHEGVGTITCEICNKVLSQKSLLIRHMKNKHDPNKPFKQKIKCDLCKMVVFDMEKHMKSHMDRSLLCGYCPKTYAEVSALNRHIKERHSGISHKCDLCPKKYVKERSLRKHKLKVHNIQFKQEFQDDRQSENNLNLEPL